MCFPFMLFIRIIFFHGKFTDLAAGLAGMDKTFHTFDIGINGRSEKRKFGFRGLDQILPQVGRSKKIADKGYDDTDEQYERNGI